MPLPDKLQSIKNIAVPTTKKQSQRLLWFINYYRDMWKHRSGIFILLSSMTSKQAKFIWSKECQRAFDTIKKLVA